ncbi:hypothetical protein VSX64_22170 [Aurantimonas sp. C2-6-R+9]|uniref:hypothetical protein n=1 Tax=unclassified Aurantimonas TaxID=2638230 RepID=UPI002E199CBF|nr:MULTISPECIES: hypothetical protein [unclassified Aurantimonas]MEC5293171.1 hypothetical protein [Aurantimonas sp. C2-3-R2]MEC5383487.1 hypothetical protein [Aurantimonas sp. C2-6-R+9]MEC5414263.1 hypothetical protein [Aurantimonas sp. C2-4-R8]
MWTPTTRARHNREHLRYETDLTAHGMEDTGIVADPSKRDGAAAKMVDARAKWSMREIVNAIFHFLRGGVRIPRSHPDRITGRMNMSEQQQIGSEDFALSYMAFKTEHDAWAGRSEGPLFGLKS